MDSDRVAPGRGAASAPAGMRASRRVARVAVATLTVGLVAAGYGGWRWHARESAEVAARLIADGQYTTAIRVLQERLADTPDDARVHYELGLAYAGAGHREGALNRLREAVERAPGEPAYHLALGRLYREAGDPVRARDELSSAVRLDPAEPRYEASLAGLLLEQGQAGAALDHLRLAVGRAPREPEIRFLLAEALGQAGDREGMAREYREVIRLAGDRPLAEAARQELRILRER